MAQKGLNMGEFHQKIQKLFRGKENKLRMIDDWVLMETLGMGGYSKVKLGLHKQTAKKAALKIMFADQSGKMSESKKKQLMSELNVMRQINHPNVIKLISFNADAKYPEANGKYTACIMTALEFAAGGELFDYLMYTGHFDDAATRSYFKQLMDGLNAMHSAGIAHRDLKPENLLMDSSFTLKIADFGFATEFKDKESGKLQLMKTPCGTRNYLAPEFWKGQKYSYKCDIFAAGIILFTTYAGFPPFMEAQPNDWWWDKYNGALEKIKRANQLRQMMKQNPDLNHAESAESKEIQANLKDAAKRMQLFWKAHSKKRQFDDEDFKDLALNLIHPNPNKRLDIAQILQHKWVVKGPLYSADQLRMYLTKRVKHVLRGRAKKIRRLMMEQHKQKNVNVRADAVRDPNAVSPMQRRIAEVDPNKEFDANIQSIADEEDDVLFPNSLFQFFTKKCAAEIAVRIEAAASRYQAQCNISPKDNLITISGGFAENVVLADETKTSRTERVTFCVKIFLVDKMPQDLDDKPLSQREDMRYLVSFKRLQGTFKAYAKIAKKYFEFTQVAEAIEWPDDIDADDDDDEDDEKTN
eukprot:75554_1